jgi:hypothetical protein
VWSLRATVRLSAHSVLRQHEGQNLADNPDGLLLAFLSRQQRVANHIEMQRHFEVLPLI